MVFDPNIALEDGIVVRSIKHCAGAIHGMTAFTQWLKYKCGESVARQHLIGFHSFLMRFLGLNL